MRRQLAEPAKGNVERADRAALAAFYAARNEPLLWVTSDGFTAKARHAMAEIRKADDWGLAASAFELPQLRAGRGSARRARRRRDQARPRRPQVCAPCTRRPPRSRAAQQATSIRSRRLRDPKVVLEAMAATETPGNYLRDLHPKHEQFQRLRQALLKARGGTAAAGRSR